MPVEWVDLVRWVKLKKRAFFLLLFEGCKSYRQTIWFIVDEVDNMLSLMTLVRLYSPLSLILCHFYLLALVWVSRNNDVNRVIRFFWKPTRGRMRVINCLWETRRSHDVNMYREGRAARPHPGCKPHNCHILNTPRTRLQQCHLECLIMTYFYFCMYISLYRELCLHVTMCCK